MLFKKVQNFQNSKKLASDLSGRKQPLCVKQPV